MKNFTIYDRFKKLNYKANPLYLKQIGQLVKNKYIEKYGYKPEKVEVSMKFQKMLVNAYPVEFLPAIDTIIHTYFKNIPKVSKAEFKKHSMHDIDKAQAAAQVEPHQVLTNQTIVEPEAVKEPGKRIRKRITVTALPVRPNIKR